MVGRVGRKRDNAFGSSFSKYSRASQCFTRDVASAASTFHLKQNQPNAHKLISTFKKALNHPKKNIAETSAYTCSAKLGIQPPHTKLTKAFQPGTLHYVFVSLRNFQSSIS